MLDLRCRAKIGEVSRHNGLEVISRPTMQDEEKMGTTAQLVTEDACAWLLEGILTKVLSEH